MLMKLLLNTKDFDGKIGKSKKEVQNLGGVGKAAMGELAGFLGKVTAAAGLAVGGFELFNKAIDSSQTLTDAWGRNMEVAKVGLDNFIYSIANADFTPMINGLSEMAQKAREMYDAFDQLNNTMMSADYLSATVGSEYRAAMAGARNKSLSFDERRAYLATAKEKNARLMEAQSVIAEDSMNALKSAIAAKTGLSTTVIDEATIKEAFELDTRFSRKEDRARIEADYDKYIEGLRAIITKVNEEYTVTTKTPYGNVVSELPNYDKAMAAATIPYKNANRELIVQYELLMRESDESLSSLYSVAKNAVSATNQIAEMSTSINEVSISLENEAAAAVKASTAAEKAAVAQREISAMAAAIYNGRGADQTGPVTGTPTVGKLPEKVQSIDVPNVWDNYLISDAEGRAKEFETVSTSVDMLSSSFSRLGGAIGGSAGEMLAFVGSVAEAAGAIIPLIANIYAEKMAHEANANAATTEAAAKTLSAYAGIPFAGLALGAVAVAGIISVLSSLPKFAEGGIATSATLGVFGEAGPEAIMPLDRLNDFIAPREVRVTGEIIGRGKNLVVAIDNYNKIQRVK